jgi:hypothetical protein
MRQWWKRRSFRRAIIAILLPALLFRAAVPAGFMPEFGAGYGLRLVLCSGLVLERGAVSDDRGAPDHGDPSHLPCLFGVGAGPAPLPTLLAVTAEPPRAAPGISAYRVGVCAAAIVRAQSPRGPPGSLHVWYASLTFRVGSCIHRDAGSLDDTSALIRE